MEDSPWWFLSSGPLGSASWGQGSAASDCWMWETPQPAWNATDKSLCVASFGMRREAASHWDGSITASPRMTGRDTPSHESSPPQGCRRERVTVTGLFIPLHWVSFRLTWRTDSRKGFDSRQPIFSNSISSQEDTVIMTVTKQLEESRYPYQGFPASPRPEQKSFQRAPSTRPWSPLFLWCIFTSDFNAWFLTF